MHYLGINMLLKRPNIDLVKNHFESKYFVYSNPHARSGGVSIGDGCIYVVVRLLAKTHQNVLNFSNIIFYSVTYNTHLDNWCYSNIFTFNYNFI